MSGHLWFSPADFETSQSECLIRFITYMYLVHWIVTWEAEAGTPWATGLTHKPFTGPGNFGLKTTFTN